VAALKVLVDHPLPQTLDPPGILPRQKLVNHPLHLQSHATAAQTDARQSRIGL
jgi:hypothetical protein